MKVKRIPFKEAASNRIALKLIEHQAVTIWGEDARLLTLVGGCDAHAGLVSARKGICTRTLVAEGGMVAVLKEPVETVEVRSRAETKEVAAATIRGERQEEEEKEEGDAATQVRRVNGPLLMARPVLAARVGLIVLVDEAVPAALHHRLQLEQRRLTVDRAHILNELATLRPVVVVLTCVTMEAAFAL
eukprot:CAMPEP_0195654656 /NCGR_PEP_ID=MMETSP0815-20121206/34034_1 /TAXON_ID=97485 /ORGANISM="Prymnesium parvum, Strain Texoma1" /LENGTH=187 /DNA_ID=CAMNT_0040798877 /DNA_START=380 /DNA_END=945 /DNA_ORIENTATION=+